MARETAIPAERLVESLRKGQGQERDPTSDPRGTPDGPSGHAYVTYKPLKCVEPDKSVLFAFDGTSNTDVQARLTADGRSESNVVRFLRAYGGPARYVTGVGTDHAGRDPYGDIIAADFNGLGGRLPDKGGNYSGPARIDRMMLYFAEEAVDNVVMRVDIVGFSRGAAQARDFANRLVATTKDGWCDYEHQTGEVDPRTSLPIVETRRQKVDLRSMYLWDTVLSTNRSGTAYKLDIPPEFSYVAQAVALNEYRSAPAGVDAGVATYPDFSYWNNTRAHLPDGSHYGGFPLESIGASSDTPGCVRIERGFIGAHSDVGGGYGENENGLATVALSWMVAQARNAGVSMNHRTVPAIDMNDPFIHDESNALRAGNPLITPSFQAPGIFYGIKSYEVEDRVVNGGLGGGTQRTQTFDAPQPGGGRGMTNADTHLFINYAPRPANDTDRTTDIAAISDLKSRTGTVDMQGYVRWLRQHGHVFAEDS